MNTSPLVSAIFKQSYLPFLAIVVLLLIFLFLKMKWDSLNEEFEPIDDYKYYVKRKYLMTEAEHNFFKVLQEVVKDRYYIVPQVQLSKIVEVNKYEKLKQKYLNKIDRKSVDFVLFDKEYFTPQIVIELDDSSHLLPKAEKNDLFKNKVLERVGIKLVRIKTAYKYDNDEILKATT